MENIILVFNNRNNAMQFATNLKRMGVNSKVVNTPRELSIACGISIIVSIRFIREVKFVVNKYRLGASIKMYAFSPNDIFKKYRPIGL